jgi:hypothetical protein
VARDIAEQIRATLNRQEQAALNKSKTVNPEAYEAYLKGRYFWNKRTGDGLTKPSVISTRAIEIGSDLRRGLFRLGRLLSHLAGDWKYAVLPPAGCFPQSQGGRDQGAGIGRQPRRSPRLSRFRLDLYGWDWQAAEKEYQRAIKLNPGYATAHQWYSWHLIMHGADQRGHRRVQKGGKP